MDELRKNEERMKEDYKKLEQEQEMMPFEEFLNESIDYGNVQLEVSEVDRREKVFMKRK